MKMPTHIRPALCLSVLLPFVVSISASALKAQAVRALPRSATDAYGLATNFGIPGTAFRAQYWFSTDNLPSAHLILSIGIRIARNVGAPSSSRNIEITVSNTPVTFAGVSSTFDANFGPSPVTFFTPRIVNFPAVQAGTDPNVAAAWFPGDMPFVHVNGNLVIDFKAGASAAALVRNDGFVMAPGTTETLHLEGRPSCGGNLRGVFNAGMFTLTATGLPAGAPGAFQIGVENTSFGGAALPFDLSVLGMPGCHMGVVPIVTVASAANGSGQAVLPIPFQTPLASSVMLSSQVLHARVPVPVSIADFGTTNAVHSTFYFAGLCNSLFADGSSALISTQGPQPVNNSIVLLLR